MSTVADIFGLPALHLCLQQTSIKTRCVYFLILDRFRLLSWLAYFLAFIMSPQQFCRSSSRLIIFVSSHSLFPKFRFMLKTDFADKIFMAVSVFR
jgi:hypothetical protein